MEAAAAAGRSVSVSQSPSRKEWRVVSENPVRDAGSEELDRSKLGHSDERTIYEQGQDALDAVDFCSIQMDGIMGVDDGSLQQRIHSLSRRREELQQMEIELRAQMIAKSEIMEIQNSYDARYKEQANIAARLEGQLREREQRLNELERQLDEKERELHAVRLDSEAAWAKEDLLREQNKELANFRRERDNIEAERAHHIKQIHELQEHIQDKDRQLLDLQEQHRVAQETIIYKDDQLREAQAWVTRLQERDLQSSTELREHVEQHNQLWIVCHRQFAEMGRLQSHVRQLQLELAGVRGKSVGDNCESSILQSTSSDGSQIGSNGGNNVEANGGSTQSGSSGVLQNGNPENSQQFVSTGNASTQANHVPSLPISPSPIIGMPSYLSPGQVTAVHPYLMQQQGAYHTVPLHVGNPHVSHFHSVPAMTSSHQWQDQQAIPEGSQMSSQNQHPLSRNEENMSRSESNYGYGFNVNSKGLHEDYLQDQMNEALDHNAQMPSAKDGQNLETADKSYLVASEAQHSLQQISSQFHEALGLEPLNHQTNEIKDNNAVNPADNGSESQDAMAEQKSSVASPSLSEASVNHMHFHEAMVNTTADSVLSEAAVSAGQANALSAGKIPETVLLDERALLACIVRTIPAGGKIRISSTLPNRLAKMLAPLHWHDYKKKYGKLDDFVARYPELFVIEEDYIQLREGAQGRIAAAAAAAKVAAAAAASSPYSPFFPSVAVTPMAHASRVKQIPSSIEAKSLRNSVETTHLSAVQSHHPNGSGFNVGGISNVKILSKGNDSLELSGPGFMPGQNIPVHAENGSHSDRSNLGNLQSKGPIPARMGAGFVVKQQGRTTSAQLAARR